MESPKPDDLNAILETLRKYASSSEHFERIRTLERLRDEASEHAQISDRLGEKISEVARRFGWRIVNVEAWSKSRNALIEHSRSITDPATLEEMQIAHNEEEEKLSEHCLSPGETRPNSNAGSHPKPTAEEIIQWNAQFPDRELTTDPEKLVKLSVTQDES
jgi:hypothetical protein